MTVKRIYKCNLCCEEVDKDSLVCLRWDATAKTESGFGAYEFIFDVNGSDKHICACCVKLIKDKL